MIFKYFISLQCFFFTYSSYDAILLNRCDLIYQMEINTNIQCCSNSIYYFITSYNQHEHVEYSAMMLTRESNMGPQRELCHSLHMSFVCQKACDNAGCRHETQQNLALSWSLHRHGNVLERLLYIKAKWAATVSHVL